MNRSTEGRKIFWRWRFGDFEIRSDVISHDYMRRWVVKLPWFTLRLHHILRGDARGEFHDHPMSFVSLILKGGYIEHRPVGGLVSALQKAASGFGAESIQVCDPGSVLFRRGEDLHWLELPPGKTAWTFLIASPYYREWGFQTRDGWIHAGRYDEWKRKQAAHLNGDAL